MILWTFSPIFFLDEASFSILFVLHGWHLLVFSEMLTHWNQKSGLCRGRQKCLPVPVLAMMADEVCGHPWVLLLTAGVSVTVSRWSRSFCHSAHIGECVNWCIGVPLLIWLIFVSLSNFVTCATLPKISFHLHTILCIQRLWSFWWCIWRGLQCNSSTVIHLQQRGFREVDFTFRNQNFKSNSSTYIAKPSIWTSSTDAQETLAAGQLRLQEVPENSVPAASDILKYMLICYQRGRPWSRVGQGLELNQPAK